MQFPIGTKVTTTQPKRAYYSSYGGNPEQTFVPGMIGTVRSERLPYVQGRGTFYCVDFIGHNGKEWRVAIDSADIRKA